MEKGFIHSIETMGALDGPGIRMVVFLQGCILRCIYCHNPDTWFIGGGSCIGSEKLVKKAVRYKPYFKLNKGGVTFSGGEPLLQPEFLVSCLRLLKEEGIHTALDTAGVGIGGYDEILKYTDLVILDVKHGRRDKYKKITGLEMDEYSKFKNAVIKNNTPLWIKHVVTPGINDTYDDMSELEAEVKTFPEGLIQKVELLPYHTMGILKYKELKMDYRLNNVPPLTEEKLMELKKYLNIEKLV